MSMSVGSDNGEDELNSEINTTPLVDIMLVLLIIFLITSPVVLKLQKVTLPAEENQVTLTKPEDVNITVNKDGEMYYNQLHLANTDELFKFLAEQSVKVPQPAVKVRGDQESRYEAIGRVIYTAQRAGVQKVGFVIEPPG
ncbi:biopolymer transporter ExbD [Oxalobacteraceae sp. CFBP 8763]|jgi:biopolymer transport protein ExbD|uniref:Biopolymer transport protein ExbD n=1 Tax=Massilia aurea TaxID=373040 RepID=A0A7W9X274_9BURK|nr:biopolymer transporter ExbD [Massilia aurea]MBB6135152.1 biopolymer transport protein ExbD [Massilia aurea]MBD8564106.1 biopolymer transporter ExbD [Oxalobacteraceae sp. CFBP 8763]RZI59803.1 MAG: biopolymer transporter ExbD [Pseudomonas sp.]